MIYQISGELVKRGDGFLVVNVNDISYKIFVPRRVFEQIKNLGGKVFLFTYLNVKEDALDLYGFLKEEERFLFEKLVSVSGIGPKSALAVMAIASVKELAAAINEGKTDLLTKVSGIGKKTAERVVVELRGKLPTIAGEEIIQSMEANNELEDILVSLGYSKMEARQAIERAAVKEGRLEDRLKEVLRMIDKK